MAKSLKIQIEMAGAEEIKRQLEGVGEAGEAAFNKILNAAKDVGGFNKLDPGVVTKSIAELGVKGEASINKITAAVRSAGRMETLINALTGVENGLVRVQTAASSLDAVLGRALLATITRIARFLPLAFAAATVGAIANTTKAILELNKAAIQLGTSIGELSKTKEIFKQLGLGGTEAAKAASDVIEKMNLAAVKRAIADIGKGFIKLSDIDVLKRAAAGVGEAADLASKQLAKMGLVSIPFTLAAQAIDKIKESTNSFSQQLLAMLSVFAKMGPTSERNRLIFQNFDKDLGAFVIQALDAGISIDKIAAAVNKMKAPTDDAAKAAALLRAEWNKTKDLMTEGFAVSPEGLEDLVTILGAVNTALSAVGTAATWVNEQLRALGMGNLFRNTISEINGIINLLGALGQAGFNAMKFIESAAIATWQTVIGWINKAIDAVRQFFSAGGGKAASAGADAGGFARGGMIGGRGTGSSDSNLAWVSRGEHIMPAYAVRQPGVLQLLEALRRSGGNLRGVLDRMGHFAMGGMVSAPAFATGGAVGGMSNVTIQFPGVQPITGLRASSAVVDELRRSAALAQVRSGGRKPSRYT